MGTLNREDFGVQGSQIHWQEQLYQQIKQQNPGLSRSVFTRAAEDKSHNLIRIDLLGVERALCALDAQVFGSRGHHPVMASACVRSLGRGEKSLPFVGPCRLSLPARDWRRFELSFFEPRDRVVSKDVRTSLAQKGKFCSGGLVDTIGAIGLLVQGWWPTSTSSQVQTYGSAGSHRDDAWSKRAGAALAALRRWTKPEAKFHGYWL